MGTHCGRGGAGGQRRGAPGSAPPAEQRDAGGASSPPHGGAGAAGGGWADLPGQVDLVALAQRQLQQRRQHVARHVLRLLEGQQRQPLALRQPARHDLHLRHRHRGRPGPLRAGLGLGHAVAGRHPGASPPPGRPAPPRDAVAGQPPLPRASPTTAAPPRPAPPRLRVVRASGGDVPAGAGPGAAREQPGALQQPGRPAAARQAAHLLRQRARRLGRAAQRRGGRAGLRAPPAAGPRGRPRAPHRHAGGLVRAALADAAGAGLVEGHPDVRARRLRHGLLARAGRHGGLGRYPPQGRGALAPPKHGAPGTPPAGRARPRSGARVRPLAIPRVLLPGGLPGPWSCPREASVGAEGAGGALSPCPLISAFCPPGMLLFARGIAGTGLHFVCVGTSTGSVLVFDVPAKGTNITLSEVLEQHNSPITDIGAELCEQPEGAADLVTADDSGALCVWGSGETFRLITKIPASDCTCSSVKLWNGVIAAGYGNGQIRLYEAAHGTLRAQVSAHARWIYALDLAPLSGKLLSAAEDSFVRVWGLSHSADTESLEIEHCHTECVTDTQICGARFCNPEGTAFAITGFELNEIILYHQV